MASDIEALNKRISEMGAAVQTDLARGTSGALADAESEMRRTLSFVEARLNDNRLSGSDRSEAVGLHGELLQLIESLRAQREGMRDDATRELLKRQESILNSTKWATWAAAAAAFSPIFSELTKAVLRMVSGR